MSVCGLPGCGESCAPMASTCKFHIGMERFIEPPNLGNGMKKPPSSAPVTPPATPASRGGGLKFDGDKPRWTLMMHGMAYALSTVVAVLTFGARKYEADSWRQVESGQERYRDAMYRHLAAYEAGELLDPESGLPHLAHVATNSLFLLELDKDTK